MDGHFSVCDFWAEVRNGQCGLLVDDAGELLQKKGQKRVTDVNGRLECSWDTGRPSQSIGGLSLRVSRNLVLDRQSCIAEEQLPLSIS